MNFDYKVWQLGMNFQLLFTKEVIPPSRCVSNSSCIRGLGEDGQSICPTTRRRYYQVSVLPPDILQRTTRPSIYDQPIKAQLRVKMYCIFLFQMGGYLECIRFRIYDRVAAYSPIDAIFLLPNPLSVCNQPSYRFRPPGMFSCRT